MEISKSTNVEEKPAGAVVPSGCACGGGSRGLVYAIGALGFDFGTYGRRDAIRAAHNGAPIYDNPALLGALLATPTDAADTIWTLSLDSHPIYAVRPTGPYSKTGYQLLESFLADPTIELLSVPGRVAGSVGLLCGQTVPVVEPDLAGVRSWSTTAVAASAPELSGRLEPAPPVADLSAEGSLDWSAWGLTGAQFQDHKRSASLPAQAMKTAHQLVVGGYIAAGLPAGLSLQTGFSTKLRWTDGTSQLNMAPDLLTTPGLVVAQGASPFTLTINVTDAVPRVLSLYVRASNGSSTLTATLGPTSTLRYTDSSLGQGKTGPTDGVYRITFSGGGSPETLTVTWAPGAGAWSGLQAATLRIAHPVRTSALQSFMDRLRHELRTLGASSRERAVNFALTSALEDGSLASAFARRMTLASITAERNERCRPQGDCWDVVLRFFKPTCGREAAFTSFRFTVDVTGLKPVLVAMEEWNEI